ncbi:hypothetical protein [Croceicoccus hydrothermalis]|uniref:hypothetical protein n=1 Tax=Croceicoccus hydrothermalis TaxID=2867964 RepID=UPI001EFBE20B|nr:hypothetical protein [Croceicoccus hydrothermalis]
MDQDLNIKLPAHYAPAIAVGFQGPENSFSLVEIGRPLPVVNVPQLGGDPLTGTADASGTVGPFLAQPAKAISIELSGEWAGSVRLLRSSDGGDTLSPLKAAGADWAVFNDNGVEQAWFETERDIGFYLQINLTSGTVSYRVSQ